MIPSPLSESDPREVIPEPTLELLHRIDRYVVASVTSSGAAQKES